MLTTGTVNKITYRYKYQQASNWHREMTPVRGNKARFLSITFLRILQNSKISPLISLPTVKDRKLFVLNHEQEAVLLTTGVAK